MEHDKALQLLEQQLVELKIQDDIRTSKQISMPDGGLVKMFALLSADIMADFRGTMHGRKRLIASFFGTSTIVMAKLWELMTEDKSLPRGAKFEHLLWALHYLKQYPNIAVMQKTMKRETKSAPTEKTIRKWTWHFIFALADLEEKVIVWENRKINDRGNDCTASVDTTDCPFQQILIPNPNRPGKMMVNKALFSYKMNGPGLRYEVGVALLSNHIVWVNGPYLPGDWNDLDIFRHAMIHELEEGERVEADDIYSGEPRYIVCPALITSTEGQAVWRRRIQGRHEVLNKHLKYWTCLSKPFVAKGTPGEKMQKHSKMFRACAVIKQVSMEMGVGELYEVGDDYE